MMSINKKESYMQHLGGFRVQQAPPIPPKKVRELQLSKRFNRRPRREMPMNHKTSLHSEAVADIENPIILPKSTYKVGLIALSHMSGHFY